MTVLRQEAVTAEELPMVWTEQNGGRLSLLDPRGFSRFMQVINSTFNHTTFPPLGPLTIC